MTTQMSQKQLHQLRSILQQNLENEHEYSDDDYSSDEEDPTPKWNIPNWKGNKKCDGCVTRTMADGYKVGCEECDEYCTLPELYTAEQIQYINRVKCTGCVTQFTSDGGYRGCKDCDDCWDMPGLCIDDVEYKCNGCNECDTCKIYYDNCNDNYDAPDDTHLAEFLYAAREQEWENENEKENKPYCEGCHLLDAGLGGENQMSHSCLGY